MIKRFISTEESDKLPNTRQEARELGARHYFTGIPCVNGHIDKRLVGTGHCAECDRVRAKSKREEPEFRAKDAARLKAMKDAKKAADIEAYRAQQAAKQRAYRVKLLLTPDGATKVKAWEEKQNRKYHDDPEYRARKVEFDRLRNQREEARAARRKNQNRRYREVLKNDPEHVAKGRTRNALWARQNKDRVNAKNAKRRSAKLQAVPPWVDEQAQDEMRIMYAVAQRVSKETGVPHEIDHMVPLKGESVCGLHTPDNLQIRPRAVNRAKHNTFSDWD